MIVLPEIISGANLARLKCYAPYVKRLELCGKRGYNYILSNWGALFDMSWSSPLLPNLTVLTLANPTWCALREGPQLPLLLMFISSSLLEFRITWELKYYVAVVSKPRAEAILYSLQHRCPKLHTLVLFSDPGLDCHEDERRFIPIDYDISDFFKAVSLRLLSVSLSMINSLPDLSIIRQVNRLNINYKGSNGSFAAFNTPELEWPNLRHLSIYSIPKIEDLSSLWDIKSLVGNLTGAQFHFRDQYYPGDSLNDSLDILLSMLARGSPNLKSLWLLRRGGRGSFVNPRTVTQVLSKLELQELEINSYRSERPKCLDVRYHLEGRAFNSLERLEVGRHRVDLLDLRFYAKSLPNLKHMWTQVKVSIDDLEYDEKDVAASLQECELYVCDAEFDGEPFEPAWEGSAKFLLLVWPNLRLSLGSKVTEKHAGWTKVFKSLQRLRQVGSRA
ncbi:hypothetical protein FS749_002976 [Ceratobasidium sp. UAMH 11750]|nr:hypothetical protein FS749_002976 [Ceratobasidium sp. UAMH 11750]